MIIEINPDWCCSGIYVRGKGYVDPSSLEISDTLKKDFIDWNASFQRTASTLGHTDKSDMMRFNQRTLDLAKLLETELGSTHKVICSTFYRIRPD